MTLAHELGIWVAWIVAIGALVAALGVITKAIGKGWRRSVGSKDKPGWIRRLIALVDDLRDVPGQVVILQQKAIENAAGIQAIKLELHPNGGGSLRDVADRIETAVGSTPPEGTHV